MSENDQRQARLWLALSEGITSAMHGRLMTHFGSCSKAYSQFPHGFHEHVSIKVLEELTTLKAIGLEKLALRLEALNISLAFLGDNIFYPALLEEIPQAPDVVFYKGTLRADMGHAVAIVGSRRETRYGRQQAYAIARDLAHQGITVVSGLARGIDTAAHQGALAGGGITIAVLGSGLSRLYPQENGELAEQIIQSGGAVISELPPTAEPLAYRFPIRNRIVSGLCQALLLVEAREKSGTLITVSHALEQGREIFAIPGEVDAPGSRIPHRMIREGARLCTSAADIMEDMGWNASAAPLVCQVRMLESNLSDVQLCILGALDVDSLGYEELLFASGLSPAELNTHLTILEMDGLMEALPGRMFRRAQR